MTARRCWLAVVGLSAVLLAGVLAASVLLMTRDGWGGVREFLEDRKGRWDALGLIALCGCVVSHPFASAWLLSRMASGPKPWRLPVLCAISGAALAVTLAASVQLLHLRLGREGYLYACVAAAYAIPVLLAGLIARWQAAKRERAWFFLPSARVLLGVAVFLGALQIVLPLEMGLFQWNVSRAKRYVEEVARGVEQASVAGRPPEDIGGVLAGLGEAPWLVRGASLNYEREDRSFRLEFFCRGNLITGHYWTYRSPERTWTRRRY
jgi:hypothetical protein